MLLALFLLLRGIFLISTLFFAKNIIPFSEKFTYFDIPDGRTLSHFVGAWANFDGEHYVRIATEGYHQFDRAFFPLYPILLKSVHSVTNIHPIFVGCIISNILFVAAIILFFKLIKEVYKVRKPYFFIALLLAQPASFFFSAVYTESLLLFLIVAALYAHHKKKYIISGLAAALSSLARLQGAFLIFPLFFSNYSFKKSLKENIVLASKGVFLWAPLLGLVAYMIYLYTKTGDPLYFLTVQPFFGAQRSASIILLPQVYYRYIKIFLTASWNYQYFIAVVEFVLFNFSFLLTLLHLRTSFKEKKKDQLGIACMSLCHILLTPLTGTFSSITRYSLFAWSPLFVVSRSSRFVRYATLLIFITLQIVLFAFFSQGHFVG